MSEINSEEYATGENPKGRVLLGIHNPDIRIAYVKFFGLAGYQVDESVSIDDMMQRASSNSHRLYLMDLNFGAPGAKNIDSSRQVYGIVRSRVESSEAKFLGISGQPENVDQAELEGISSAHTGEFSLFDLLK